MNLLGAPICTQTAVVIFMLVVNIIMTVYKQNPISYSGLAISIVSILLVQFLCGRRWFYTSWFIALMPFIPVVVFTVMSYLNKL